MPNTIRRPRAVSRLMSAALCLAAALGASPSRADVPANGWVVWASNREDSRREIYLMKADGSGVQRLTYNGGQFPAWSPNGKWIGFTNNGSAYVIRPDGSGQKQVCDGMEFWTWKHGGGGLVCGTTSTYKLVDPDTGAGQPLFSKSDFPKLNQVDGPIFWLTGITHDGKYGLFMGSYKSTPLSNGTFPKGYAALAQDLTNKDNTYLIGYGCEPHAPPAGNAIYHICGKEGPCSSYPDIYKLDLSELSKDKDNRTTYVPEMARQDSDWGHEYFPRVSNDNKWLVYGATTGCHDHESCDYEIFIHRLGAGNTNRTRLTNHKANDTWPSIFVGVLSCTNDSQCDDQNPCTKDSCGDGACAHAVIAGCCAENSQCNDNDPCTIDSCDDNVCSNAPNDKCCTDSAQCNDDDPCTADVCTNNTCQQSPISGCCIEDIACDDGSRCTSGSCTENRCEYAPLIGCCSDDTDCTDNNPCTTDSCELATGTCINDPAAACCAFDTDCDDDDPCTSDSCDLATNVCLNEPPGSCHLGATDAGPSNDPPAGEHDPARISARLVGGCAISDSCDLAALLLLLPLLLARGLRRAGLIGCDKPICYKSVDPIPPRPLLNCFRMAGGSPS